MGYRIGQIVHWAIVVSVGLLFVAGIAILTILTVRTVFAVGGARSPVVVQAPAQPTPYTPPPQEAPPQAPQQPTPVPAQPACPQFGGIQTTPIGDGGCKLNLQPSPIQIVIPSGWWSLFWNGQKVCGSQFQLILTAEASFYPGNPPDRCPPDE